jgi:allantoinase
MTAVRGVGMDHPHYDYSAWPSRAPVRWPGGAPVAVGVVVLLEHLEARDPDGFSVIAKPNPVPQLNYPNAIVRFSAARDYGERVGIFRILDALRRAGIPPTVAVDAMTAERLPSLVESCREYSSHFVAHGISASRPISSQLNEATERAYIAETLDRLEAVLGVRPTGWFGPEYSESARTPQLLDEAGLDYLCDWPNDEQPYYLKTPHRLLSIPTTYSLEDANTLVVRYVPLSTWVDNIASAFENLTHEGEHSGKTLLLVVRPWITGKAFRIAAFERALTAITCAGSWPATTGDIAAAFRRALPG